MKIYFDIGNTNIKTGIYEDTLVSRFMVKTHQTYSGFLSSFKKEFLGTNIDLNSITDCLYSSVVPSINALFESAILSLLPNVKIRKMDETYLKHFSINVDDPLEIGHDLLIDVYGAINKYSYPTLIVDLGTANKVLFIDKNGMFSSVVIAPGIEMGTNALADKTDLLPNNFNYHFIR